MDREKIFEDVPIFILLAILVLTRILPPEISQWLFWGGLAAVIAFIGGTEYSFRIAASKYLYILGIVCPTNSRLHLFVTEPRNGIQSRLIDPEHNIYATTLTLGVKLANKAYRDVRQIVLKHQLPWEKRVIALPGTAVYKGYSVDHSKTATLVLWVPKEGQTMIDHLEPIPIFVIAHAPRDYDLATNPVTIESDAVALTENGENSDNANAEVLTLRAENDRLKNQVVEYKRYGFDQHQAFIRLEGAYQQIKNEFRGALSRTRDVSKLVLEELMTVLSAHSEIVEAVNEYKTRPWLRITTGAALIIVGIVGFYFFETNQDLRTWVTNNSILIIALAVCAVFVFGFLFGRRRKP